MKTKLFLCLFALASLSCGKQRSHVTNKSITHDVISSAISADLVKEIKDAREKLDPDCTKHLKNITCLSESKESGFDIACSKEKVSEEMLSQLTGVLNDIPEPQRNVFCQLDRLQIHTKIKSLGYATKIVTDAPYEYVGTMFGIRIDYLFNKINKDVDSWKEQLNYGMSKLNDPDYIFDPNGPKIDLGMTGYENFFLLEVITHELSHIIDYLNDANAAIVTQIEGTKTYNLVAPPESFAPLSWPTAYIWDPEATETPQVYFEMYPLLQKKCYYYCGNATIPVEQIGSLYNELINSSFFTSYAAFSEMEDFADSSFYVLTQDRGVYYYILDGDNKIIFSFQEQFKKEKLQPKIKWIKDFYARKDLRYH